MKISNLKIIRKNRKAASAVRKGFSLLEMIVAMFISTLIVTVVVAAFASAFRSRESAGNTQRSIEEAKTAMEYMAKIIRMSSNVKVIDGGASVQMYSKSLSKCVKFKYDSNKIAEYRCDPEATDVGNINRGPCYYSTGSDPDLTPCSGSSDFPASLALAYKEITGSSLNSAGFYTPGLKIDRVTIRMEMLNDSNAKMQTTVSARDYRDLNPTGQ
jgi:prepilin-type N-terminal cleavage/methylation domain-containing protein